MNKFKKYALIVLIAFVANIIFPNLIYVQAMEMKAGDIVLTLENPIQDQKLTSDFQVKGYALSNEGIKSVEVFVDGNSVGMAQYGIERKDINTKYPNYTGSLNSGFKLNVKGIANGVHAIKVVVTTNSNNKSETNTSINIDNQRTPVMGIGSLTREQMIKQLRNNTKNVELSYIIDFVDYTIKEARIEGVNHDILFSQMMLETGYLKFGGDVSITQNNFAGIGATGNGQPGHTFESVQIGIRAVVQHLKAYASTEPLVQTCVDPRFKYVARGSAPYVEHLGIQENPEGYGWATGREYGYKILRIVNDTRNQNSNLQLSKVTSLDVTGTFIEDQIINIKTSATPANETLYKIWVCDRNTGVWTVLSDYSTRTEASFVPNEGGRYTVVVHAKHKDNTTLIEDSSFSKDVIVKSNTKSKVTNFEVSGIKKVGETLTIKAMAEPSNETLYKLWVCDRSTNTWTVLSDYSKNNIATFKPTKEGNYTFVAHVKHITNTSNDEDQSVSIDVNINSIYKVGVSSFDVTGNPVVGETLTMKAVGNKAEDTVYKLWVCDRSTNTWTVLSDYSSINTVNFKPTKAGKYTFTAHLKHKNKDGTEEDVSVSKDVYVENSKITLKNLDVAGKLYKGSELTINAKVEPNNEVLYKIWICDRTTGEWKVLSDYSSNTTAKYIPVNAGTHTVTIHVKYKNTVGNDEDASFSKNIEIANNPEITVNNINVTGDFNTGQPLNFTVNAQSKEELEYKLWVCDRSTNQWYVLSDYSSKNTISYVPTKSGNYTFTAHIKHKYNTSKDEEVSVSKDIVVKSQPIVQKSLDITGAKYVGSQLNIATLAEPNNEILYKIWICDRTTGEWKVLSDYSSNRTAKYIPINAGRHTVTIHVKYKNTVGNIEDASFSKDIEIANPPKITVNTINVTGDMNVGQALNFTVNAQSKEELEYKLWVCDRSTNTWTVLSDYSSKNTISYVPTKAGNYTFTAHIKHKYNTSKDEEVSISKDVAVKSQSIVQKSLDITGEKYVGSQLTVSTLAEPNNSILYKIWVCDRTTGEWTVLSDYSTTRTAKYIPKNVGKYTFTIHVKDKNKPGSEEDLSFSKDINIKAEPKIDVSKIDVIGTQTVGRNVKLKVEATSESELEYKLWICDRTTNTWTVLSDYSSKNEVDFKPTKKGDYTFTAYIKHKYKTGQAEDISVSKNFNVKEGNLSAITDLKVTGDMEVSYPIKMSVEADPDVETLYKLWVCDRSTNTWTVLSDYSSKKEVIFTPTKEGKYTFTAHVKNKKSNNIEEDDSKSVDVEVSPKGKSKVLNLSVEGTKKVNEPLTMKVSATPPDKTLYKLWVCDRSTNTWTVLSDYGSNNEVQFTPKKDGRYTFTAHVKHINNGTNDEDQSVSQDIIIKSNKVIVIDAGHGGSDPGATAEYNGKLYKESDFTITMANITKQKLESMGYTVYMSRTNINQFVELSDRAKFANDMNADFLLSIHSNSFTSSSANGIEVLYSDRAVDDYMVNYMVNKGYKDPNIDRKSRVEESKKFASSLLNGVLGEVSFSNRGVKEQNLHVCRNANMPSALIELGFISNYNDAMKIFDPVYQEKIANGIAKGINNILK